MEVEVFLLLLRIAEPPVGSTGRALSTGWCENQMITKPGPEGQVVLSTETAGVKVTWRLNRERWLRTCLPRTIDITYR